MFQDCKRGLRKKDVISFLLSLHEDGLRSDYF